MSDRRVGLDTRAMWRTTTPLVLAFGGAALAPAVILWLRGGHDPRLATLLGALVSGAGAGAVADDPSDSTVGAVPITLGRRRWARARVVATLLVAVLFAVLVVADRIGPAPVGTAILVFAATSGLAMGVATSLVAGHQGPQPQPVALTSGVIALLAVLTVVALSQRFAWLPELERPGGDRRWLWLAAASALVAVVRSRDPAAPPVHRGRDLRPWGRHPSGVDMGENRVG